MLLGYLFVFSFGAAAAGPRSRLDEDVGGFLAFRMGLVCSLLRVRIRFLAVCAAVLLLAGGIVSGGPLRAEETPRLVRLAVPQVLVDTGLLAYILPRFSLKTQIRVHVVPVDEAAEARLDGTAAGTPVFSDADTTWHLDLVAPDHAGAKRLRKWLTSDVGVRAIAAYAPAGVAMFRAPEVREAEVAELSWDGDADLGYSLSRVHCGRCHAVDEAGRMNSIGSTPSFFVLRTLSDWEGRFQAFYALKPHPAFTQIADVTAPFDEARPSPIVPVEMTLEELENIMAYVALLAPADLGAPLEQK